MTSPEVISQFDCPWLSPFFSSKVGENSRAALGQIPTHYNGKEGYNSLHSPFPEASAFLGFDWFMGTPWNQSLWLEVTGGGDTKIELIQSPSLGLPVVQFHHIPWGWGRSRVPKGICDLVPRRDSKCCMASSSFPHAISPSKNSGTSSDSPALVLTSLGLFRFISSHFTPKLAARALA